jgi:hypothetical protein
MTDSTFTLPKPDNYIFKTKVLLSREWMTLAGFDYPILTLWFSYAKDFYVVLFSIIWHWACLVVLFPRRVVRAGFDIYVCITHFHELWFIVQTNPDFTDKKSQPWFLACYKTIRKYHM